VALRTLIRLLSRTEASTLNLRSARYSQLSQSPVCSLRRLAARATQLAALESALFPDSCCNPSVKPDRLKNVRSSVSEQIFAWLSDLTKPGNSRVVGAVKGRVKTSDLRQSGRWAGRLRIETSCLADAVEPAMRHFCKTAPLRVGRFYSHRDERNTFQTSITKIFSAHQAG
jgi:hypothetical protein